MIRVPRFLPYCQEILEARLIPTPSSRQASADHQPGSCNLPDNLQRQTRQCATREAIGVSIELSSEWNAL